MITHAQDKLQKNLQFNATQGVTAQAAQDVLYAILIIHYRSINEDGN